MIMNRFHRLTDWMATLAGALLLTLPLAAAEFSEPHLVLYGRILATGIDGQGRLLTRGTLRFVLENRSNPAQRVVRTETLRPVGPNGEYSYRHEIPVFYLPDAFDSGGGLSAGAARLQYRIVEATVDGTTAQVRDPGQAKEVTTSFANRGDEIRIDLEASVPQVDTDNDGIADWYEEQNGLNPRLGTDGQLDADQDGLSNLAEYLAGTNPQRANTYPAILETSLSLPAGGESGFSVPMVSPGTEPKDLSYHRRGPTPGLTWKRRGAPLESTTPFTHAEVLAGDVTLEVSATFSSAAVDLELRQAGTKPSTNTATLQLSAYSPATGIGAAPVAWLDATGIPAGPIWEWTDRSGAGRDTYQPRPELQPRAADRTVGFRSGQFLYWDDQDLRLAGYTVAFAASVEPSARPVQTLFNGVGIEVAAVGGPQAARSLRVVETGRVTRSGPLDGRIRGVISSEGARSRLDLLDHGTWQSASNTAVWTPSFSTFGASRALGETQASRALDGSLSEWVLFDAPLDAKGRARIRNYLLAKWEGVVVWDHRMDIRPVQLTGRSGVRNALSGGLSTDQLTGSDRDDLLDGGPGDDRLLGGPGGDQFLFGPDGSRDVVGDFSTAQGDVLDLSDIFDKTQGLIANHLKVRPVVRRDGNNVPRVDSILELRRVAGSANPDQTLTLEGVSWSDADLPRWASLGVLRLGALRATDALTAPVIEASPADLSGRVDEAVSFEVVASGGEPLAYQWLLDGTPIPGAQGSRYHLPGLRLADAGQYSVRVTNAAGSVTSAAARLKVSRIPATIQFSGLEQPLDGTPRCVTVTTEPPGLPVRITYDGSESCPVGPGSFRIEARILGDRHQGELSSTFVITDQVRPARLEALVVNGFLVGVRILDKGHGFSRVPQIQIVGGGGTGAQLLAVVGQQGLVEVKVVSPGSGFTSAPELRVEAPAVPPLQLTLGEASLLRFGSLSKDKAYRLQRQRDGVWEEGGVDLTGVEFAERWVSGPAEAYRLAEAPVPRPAVVDPTVVGGFLVGGNILDPGIGYATPPRIRVVGQGATGAVVRSQITGGRLVAVRIENTGTPVEGPIRIEVEPPPVVAIPHASVDRGVELVLGGLVPNTRYELETSPRLDGSAERERSPILATNEVHHLWFLPSQPVRFFQLRRIP